MSTNYSDCSESFLNLVKYECSFKDADVTSFLPKLIPIANKLNVFGVECAAIPSPFSTETLVTIPVFEAKEKARGEFTKSIRKIPPIRNRLLDSILNIPNHLGSLSQRTEFLIQNAKTLHEITAASYLDMRIPKPDASIVSQGFSDSHQKAANKAFKSKNIKTKPKNKIQEQSENLNKELEFDTKYDEELEHKLKNIFSEISPIPELSKPLKGFWQWDALKSLQSKKKGPLPGFWKRNRYPPQTKEERLMELRKKSQKKACDEEGELDLLPGIWIPEFMIPEFNVTGLNYDSRLKKEQVQELDWETLHMIKEKCDNWLEIHKDLL